MNRNDRLKLILDLVGSKDIATQGEMVAELNDLGIEVSQGSVSRDIDELGLTKVDGYYRRSLPQSSNEFHLASLEAIGENLIVGHCPSGLASAITVRIDAAALRSVAGTIAGDDTIMIAVRNADDQQQAIEKIWQIFGRQ